MPLPPTPTQAEADAARLRSMPGLRPAEPVVMLFNTAAGRTGLANAPKPEPEAKPAPSRRVPR
jgi:hypothetical protein